MAKKPPRKKRKPKKKKDVVVNSNTYGTHTRAPRGSIKKAELNDAFVNGGIRLTASNVPAKLIRDALVPFLENFKGGQFWQRLLSHFSAQAKAGKDYSVEDMDHYDVNTNYPLSQIIGPRIFEVNTDMPSLSMEITCNYYLNDRFLSRNRSTDSMQLTVIALFPDFKENDITFSSAVLPPKKLNDQDPYSFILPIPSTATSYIFFWKLETCENGQVKSGNSNAGKAIHLMKSGLL